MSEHELVPQGLEATGDHNDDEDIVRRTHDSMNKDERKLRSAPPGADSVPGELRALPQWVCWRGEERAGKLTKIPIDAKTRRNASSTNRQTWATFEETLAACEARGLDGVGFVLTRDDGIVGIDLDHCIADDGSLADWAERIVTMIDTYTEFSPSGTGLHLFVQGEWPAGRRNRKDGIEVYGARRFLTVTGRRWPETSASVGVGQDALDQLARELGTPKTAAAAISQELQLEANASPNAERMAEFLSGSGSRRRKALWELSGDGAMLPKSQSERDMALANQAVQLGWPDQEVANLIIAHRRRHNEQPAKALRLDYMQRTIATARERGSANALALLPFGNRVRRLVQLGEVEAEYLLELDGGVTIELGGSRALTSPAAFAEAIIQAGYQLPPAARRGFEDVVAALLKLRVVETFPTSEEALRDQIHDEIAQIPSGYSIIGSPGGPASISQALTDMRSNGLAPSGGKNEWVFPCMDGTVYVVSERLRRHLNLQSRIEVHPKTLASRLRRIGFGNTERVSFSIFGKPAEDGGSGRRIQATVWHTDSGWADMGTLKIILEAR